MLPTKGVPDKFNPQQLEAGHPCRPHGVTSNNIETTDCLTGTYRHWSAGSRVLQMHPPSCGNRREKNLQSFLDLHLGLRQRLTAVAACSKTGVVVNTVSEPSLGLHGAVQRLRGLDGIAELAELVHVSKGGVEHVTLVKTLFPGTRGSEDGTDVAAQNSASPIETPPTRPPQYFNMNTGCRSNRDERRGSVVTTRTDRVCEGRRDATAAAQSVNEAGPKLESHDSTSQRRTWKATALRMLDGS